jgi:hypothetical protein
MKMFKGLQRGTAGIGDPGAFARFRGSRKARSPIPSTAILLIVVGLVFSDTHYVDINSTNPVAPYTSWETAATAIQRAVDEAIAGDQVLIADGTYPLESQVTVRQGLAIRSVNGPDVTILDGDGDADLLLAFQRRRLKLDDACTTLILTGESKE